MGKRWLYGYEVMREWQITDVTLLQWLLDGLPAYSPNSLKKIEKRVLEKEGLTSFYEWKTATSFRTYTVEGFRKRLFALVFIRPEIEAVAAGGKRRKEPDREPRTTTDAFIAGQKHIMERLGQIDWTMIKGWVRKGSFYIRKVMDRL